MSSCNASKMVERVSHNRDKTGSLSTPAMFLFMQTIATAKEITSPRSPIEVKAVFAIALLLQLASASVHIMASRGKAFAMRLEALSWGAINLPWIFYVLIAALFLGPPGTPEAIQRWGEYKTDFAASGAHVEVWVMAFGIIPGLTIAMASMFMTPLQVAVYVGILCPSHIYCQWHFGYPDSLYLPGHSDPLWPGFVFACELFFLLVVPLGSYWASLAPPAVPARRYGSGAGAAAVTPSMEHVIQKLKRVREESYTSYCPGIVAPTRRTISIKFHDRHYEDVTGDMVQRVQSGVNTVHPGAQVYVGPGCVQVIVDIPLDACRPWGEAAAASSGFATPEEQTRAEVAAVYCLAVAAFGWGDAQALGRVTAYAGGALWSLRAADVPAAAGVDARARRHLEAGVHVVPAGHREEALPPPTVAGAAALPGGGESDAVGRDVDVTVALVAVAEAMPGDVVAAFRGTEGGGVEVLSEAAVGADGIAELPLPFKLLGGDREDVDTEGGGSLWDGGSCWVRVLRRGGAAGLAGDAAVSDPILLEALFPRRDAAELASESPAPAEAGGDADVDAQLGGWGGGGPARVGSTSCCKMPPRPRHTPDSVLLCGEWEDALGGDSGDEREAQ